MEKKPSKLIYFFIGLVIFFILVGIITLIIYNSFEKSSNNNSSFDDIIVTSSIKNLMGHLTTGSHYIFTTTINVIKSLYVGPDYNGFLNKGSFTILTKGVLPIFKFSAIDELSDIVDIQGQFVIFANKGKIFNFKSRNLDITTNPDLVKLELTYI